MDNMTFTTLHGETVTLTLSSSVESAYWVSLGGSESFLVRADDLVFIGTTIATAMEEGLI